jgi:hypothetical protein
MENRMETDIKDKGAQIKGDGLVKGPHAAWRYLENRQLRSQL